MWSRYRGGRRGYSGSGRAGRYGGTPLWTNVDEQDARTTVIAMIEDPEALPVIDQIANVDGLDGFFIGRGDLTGVHTNQPSDAFVSRAAFSSR